MAKHTTQPRAVSRRNVTINLRALERQRDLIDSAAAAVGKSRSDFMLESACAKAQEVLLDQRYFSVGEEEFAKYLAIINAPPQPNEGLRKLMNTPDPWDRKDE